MELIINIPSQRMTFTEDTKNVKDSLLVTELAAEAMYTHSRVGELVTFAPVIRCRCVPFTGGDWLSSSGTGDLIVMVSKEGVHGGGRSGAAGAAVSGGGVGHRGRLEIRRPRPIPPLFACEAIDHRIWLCHRLLVMAGDRTISVCAYPVPGANHGRPIDPRLQSDFSGGHERRDRRADLRGRGGNSIGGLLVARSLRCPAWWRSHFGWDRRSAHSTAVVGSFSWCGCMWTPSISVVFHHCPPGCFRDLILPPWWRLFTAIVFLDGLYVSRR